MAWNGPPPHYGPHANAFWDFARAFDPSGRGFGGPGAGVDRTPGGGDAGNFFFGGGGGPGGHPFFGFGNPPPFGTFGGPWPPRQSNDESENENDETAARPAPETQREAAGEEDVSMNEKEGSPETIRGEWPAEGEHPPPPHHPGHRHPHGHHGCHHHGGPGPHRGGCRGGHGGMRGQCRPGPYSRGSGFPAGCPPPPPPPGGAWPLGGGAWPFAGGNGWFGGGRGRRGGRGRGGGAWDFDPVIQALASHPYAQNLRDYIDRAAQRAAAAGNTSNVHNNNNEGGDDSGAEGAVDDDIETFTPPVDTFRTSEGGWVLHFALPGAKKEDVGVHWDADRGTLTVSGVVYRPGSEEFLRGLVAGERSVGVFKREVKLPPPEEEEEAYREKEKEGEKDEVDGEGITAKMEDGVLLVRVPTVEREWTEVRKVDIL